MEQEEAESFDRRLGHAQARYALHEDLALRIGSEGIGAALRPAQIVGGSRSTIVSQSRDDAPWRAPRAPARAHLGHLLRRAAATPARCFGFGQLIRQVVAKSPWNVGLIGTGGLSHFPELLVPRVGEADTVFDRRLIHWMERGEHEPLQSMTMAELHKTGEHEFLNWMVVLGAISPAPGDLRYFGELGRINLAAFEWRLA